MSRCPLLFLLIRGKSSDLQRMGTLFIGSTVRSEQCSRFWSYVPQIPDSWFQSLISDHLSLAPSCLASCSLHSVTAFCLLPPLKAWPDPEELPFIPPALLSQ